MGERFVKNAMNQQTLTKKEKDLPEVDVIVAHHQGELVLKAIHSILLSRGVKIRLIVATSVSTVNFHGAKTIFVPGGPAKKRNVAFRFTESEYMAFFDDDVEVTPLAILHMVRALQKDKIGMVFGKTLNMEFHNRFDEAGSFLTPTGFLWARAESGIEDKGQYNTEEYVLAGKSAACMIRRRAFLDAGLFDESYEILGEETDLSWRVWLSGWKVLYVPSSVTYHAFNTKFKPRDFYVPRRVYFNGCRNYISMLLTNFENLNFIIPTILQTIVWISASVGMILTGKFEAGTYILKGLLYVATHLPAIFEKRKKVQGSRKISDKELMPMIMRTPPISYYLKRFFRYISTGLHG